MPITDVLIYSISGYVFIVPGILLYFWLLKKSGKKQTPLHIASVCVFCYYLIGVLTMTGMGKLKTFSPRIGLISFRGMIRSIDARLNVALFFPLGFFLPLLYKKYNRISRVALTGFLFSLSIELIQMFGRGVTDINDLITNTVGACLGYFVYKLLAKGTREELRSKFQADKSRAASEVLFFIAYSFVVMIGIQPLVLHSQFMIR